MQLPAPPDGPPPGVRHFLPSPSKSHRTASQTPERKARTPSRLPAPQVQARGPRPVTQVHTQNRKCGQDSLSDLDSQPTWACLGAVADGRVLGLRPPPGGLRPGASTPLGQRTGGRAQLSLKILQNETAGGPQAPAPLPRRLTLAGTRSGRGAHCLQVGVCDVTPQPTRPSAPRGSSGLNLTTA